MSRLKICPLSAEQFLPSCSFSVILGKWYEIFSIFQQLEQWLYQYLLQISFNFNNVCLWILATQKLKISAVTLTFQRTNIWNMLCTYIHIFRCEIGNGRGMPKREWQGIIKTTYRKHCGLRERRQKGTAINEAEVQNAIGRINPRMVPEWDQKIECSASRYFHTRRFPPA